MREAVFAKLNGRKWKEIEAYVNDPIATDPDKLSRYFIQLTDDLSYARTQYPDSQTTDYLNAISSKVHHMIYVNKKEKSSRFVTFWTTEVPLALYNMRKELLLSLVVFAVAVAIGVISSIHDTTFTRLILGDAYVDMTLENIEKGDPTGVYSSMSQIYMFLMITFNNIRVSFIVFAFGVFFGLGTGIVLLSNGIMLGAFQTFFYLKGLLFVSFLSIWIHGTIEITCIVIAGGAGFHMGRSLMYPGTLPRITSFTRGAKTGVKVLIGLIPLFIAAGFLESFVTRYSNWHWFPKLSIIVCSLALVIYYFGILPYITYLRTNDTKS